MMKKFLLSCFALCAFAAFAYEPGPRLVADYDRDGRISPADRERALSGDEFTIWINDDDDADGDGDTNNDLHDVPCGKNGEGNPHNKDCEDDQVNGRCDLLDFFPVLVNVREVADWEYLTWKLCSDSVNVVFTGLKADNAGSFHTKDVDDNDGTSLHKASVAKLTEDGVALPSVFLDEAGEGVFVIEGRKRGQRCLTLRGYKYDEVVAEVTMNLDVENVESLYGWMNLRPESREVERRGGDGQWKVENSSVRLPTSTDQRHFILVHGYNTNHEEARGNAAEFYKKLWQSGSDAMFTAVEWRGDQSQIKFDLIGVNFTPNYYVNAENAFLAARPFADVCKKLPGEKILVGHSLGNLLISSAIKDYGLDYTKFVMLNAAVPREAYDANAYDEDMVDEDWLGDERDEVEKLGGGGGGDSLTNHLDRASRWYQNFAGKEYDPYEYRRKLAWRGRFANLPRTVNYYSQSDNVLLNPDPSEKDPDKLFARDDQEIWRGVRELLVAKLVNGRSIGSGGSKKTGFGFWSFSEKMKGTWLLDAINDVLTNVLEVAQADAYKREGGWGENEDYDDNSERPFDPANTRFTPFLDERLKEWGMLDILPAETERVRAQHLADAIPAESFAAGANPVATLENVDEESFIGENPDWPLYEGEEVHTNVWNHSAFREVAFYHTSKLYASLAAVGKPRVIIDTDLGSSMDDLFTVDLAARMHREGKLDLMAVMIDRPDGCNPPDDPHGRGEFLTFADRYLASLGLGDLQIGKSESLPKDQTVFNPYWTLIHSNNVTGVGLLLPTNRTPEQIAALPTAVALYRRLLANAPDKSVIVCSTGFLSNLKGLMESGEDYEGDGIWSTGLNLIAAKVKELRIMGGCFDYSTAPDGTDGAEYNFAGDPAAAKKVVEEWPTPVVLSPWEVGLQLDYKKDDVLADFPAGTFDPVVRAAYTYWPNPLREGDLNRLWDPMTVLPLIEGEAFLPLSAMGWVSVDGFGKTTFVTDPSSDRCYQVASNMSATAVMNRLREIYRKGNPSVTMLVSGKPEPGVDYNGSELVFKFENLQLGSFSEEDLRFSFAIDGAEYAPESSEWDDRLGVLSVRFEIPPDAVTAGNDYVGKLSVFFENAKLGTNVLVTASRKLAQGDVVTDCESEWFFEFLDAPTNYVPETEMPEKVTARVTTTVNFDGEPFEERFLSSTGAVQTAVRIVDDAAGGYKFRFYALVADEEENLHEGWWDCNVSNVVPVAGKSYEMTAELMYPVDAQQQLYTVAFFAKDVQDNRPAVPVFLGNMIDDNGGIGNAGRLGSVSFTEKGEEIMLEGLTLIEAIDANLARIDDYDEYATVAEAVAAAAGRPIRLLHAASWKPTAADLGKPVRFLNKSCLNLDLSGLPANARTVWTEVDGNNGTMALELVYADTVVYGTIRTAEEENPVAEAIAIADGRYVYVGDEAGAAAFVKDGVTRVVDHRGKGMVMPGCTDGHSHYTMKFSLDNMKGSVMFALEDDKTAVLQKLSAAARTAKDAGKQSLYGFGWNIVTLRVESKLTLKELDDATYGVSTVIFDQAGHSAYCNSECLKRCGIIDGRGNVLITKIDGGLLELDDQDYPTGYVNERVTGYLMRMGGIVYDEIIDDEVAEAAIRATQELLLSTGYTTVLEGWSNMLHPSKLYAAAHRMDTNGVLKLVFPMTYEVEPWQTNMTEQIDYLASLKETYGTRHVLPDYLKIFMDGVVETRTGAISKPYKDGTAYKSFWSVERLTGITELCNARGLTVHTHVMGDAAINETADAYIRGGDGTHRNCLVHLRNVLKEDLPRFADNNIACTAGFTWHAASVGQDEFLSQFLDDEYVYHAYPMKSFFDAGVKVSSHSDFPANIPSPQDPFGIMQVAVTGMVPNPEEGETPYDTNELITVEQAFQALTLNGAWQLGLENERGSIKVGKWADFVLADQDVFACAATNIAKTAVVSTWFEGERVYQAGVPVTPGTAIGPFDTAEEATNVAKNAVLVPRPEVEAKLGKGSDELRTYCKMFGFAVGPSEGGKWSVEAALYPEDWTNVVKSAQTATRQIPVAKIAALELGVATNVTVEGCVPGFYYSFYSGGAVTNLRALAAEGGRNVLCGTDGDVKFSGVVKPSDAAGFFSIGVKETPGVMPSESVPRPPVPRIGLAQ